MIAIVLFLDALLKLESTLEDIIFDINPHKDHISDIRLHLEDLNIIDNQTLLIFMTATLKTFQSTEMTLRLIRIPLKSQTLKFQQVGFIFCIFDLKTKLVQIYLQDCKPFLCCVAVNPFLYSICLFVLQWLLKRAMSVIKINRILQKVLSQINLLIQVNLFYLLLVFHLLQKNQKFS